MVSREMIEIILKAEDQASQVIKENEENIKRFGDAAKQANQKASQASQQLQQKTGLTGKEVNNLSSKLRKVGENGKSSFDKLSKSEQDSLIKFNMLDKGSQNLLQHINKVGNANMSGLQGAISDAKSKFQALDGVTKTWSGSLDYSKSKLQLLGTNTDSLRGKIQTVGMAIPTYIGAKWDSVKTKVSSLGQSIRSKIGSAIDTVNNKLGGLNGRFNKLNSGVNKAGKGLGFLGGAASMAAGMVGFELFNSFVETGRAAINAQSQLDYFSKRLGNMKGESHLTTEKFKEFKNELGGLQKEFRKVDMTAVGATAEELAVKMQLPVNKLDDLTRMTAVMSSQFVKEGRTQEDAVLAVADALDGQFMKLKEIGISQDMLKKNGWDGNLENQKGLIDALNKSMNELGYDQTAKDITNLDEAYGALSISGGQLLTKILIPMTPVLISIMQAAMNVADGIGEFVEGLVNAWNSLPDWGKDAILIAGVALAVGLLVANFGGLSGILFSLGGMIAPVITLIGSISWPLVAIVAAIGLIVAAIYELGKAFGWWKDAGTMIEAIKNNIMRLWDAFINNPNVQGFIQGIGNAWKWLLEVTKPVVDWLSGIWETIFPESATGQWDITRSIIDAIGFAFNVLVTPIKLVYSVLQLLYPYMLQFYQGALVPLGNFLVTIFTPVWQLLQSIIAQISPMVLSVTNAFVQFANGQLPLPGLIQNVMTNLWNIYTTILTSIVNAVTSWASKIVSRGVKAAGRFVSGIVNRITSLPGRIATYLYQVVNRIVSAGGSWVSNGIGIATRMVSGVVNNIRQLPGKVYTEFINIGGRIMQAGGDLVRKAADIGKNIVNGLLNAMGIHSPGIIQEKVVTEFVNMIGRVGSKVKSAYDTAKTIGDAIVDGFGNPQLETNMDNLLPNEDAIKTEVGVKAKLSHPIVPSANATLDTSMVNSSNEDVITSFNNLSNKTGIALNDMISKDKKAYETIRNNDNTQLSAMTNNLQSKMSSMSNNVKNNMNTIVNKNKTGMNNVKNTTKTQLNNIVTKTKSANAKMIESWTHMKNGIVSAADKIKSDSTSHFNKLENTIGSFYRKLQNPGGFGAGPVNGNVSRTRPLRRASTNGFNHITNAIRRAQLPSYLTLSQIRSNPFIDTSNIGSYITTSGRNNKFSLADLIRAGNIRIPVGLEDPKNKGAGSWTDGVKNHVQKIKDKSKNWSMKGPKIIGKYQTNHGFKVKEFLNGVPNIDFATFKSMAEDVFSQCHYEFYWDSQKYGNWMTAFQHGGMNCSDSSDALIAMAQSMGLSASKVHGHWNKFGHFWANIAGHKMDTTGWMTQRNWTPSASHAGPAPRGFGFEDLINAIKDLFDDDPNKPNNNTIPVDSETVDTVKIEGKIEHTFLNLPDGITAEEVARLVNDAPNNENWIKSLVKNVRFQKYDLKEKGRIEAKNNRAKGV